MKNDKILSRRELRHYWSGSLGGGQAPFVIITEFANTDDMINRNADGAEARRKAWPDEDERKAFFEKRNKYLAWGHKDIAIHSNLVKLNKRLRSYSVGLFMVASTSKRSPSSSYFI